MASILVAPVALGAAVLLSVLMGNQALESLRKSTPERADMIIWVGIVFAVGLVAILVVRSIRSQCRFVLHIGHDRLTFGSGWFRSVVPCHAVETICYRAREEDKPKTHHLVLIGGGVQWTLPFGLQSRDCMEALINVCRHAALLYMDRVEIERPVVDSPVRMMRNRIRTYHRRAWWTLGYAIPCFAATLYFAVILADQGWLIWGKPILLTLGILGCLRAFMHMGILFHRARKLSASMTQSMDLSGIDDDDASEAKP